MKHPLQTLIVLLVFTLNARAEYSAFAGQTIVGGSVQDNGLSAQITKDTLSKQTINYNPENANNGADYKFGDAGSQAGTGAAIQAATGATMIGIGSGMVPSIIASVSAAGATLIVKGIMELAQAAANASASSANSGRETILQNYSYETPAQTATKPKVQFPSQLEDLLRGQGINPDAFASDLMAGRYPTEQDLLNALGLDQIGKLSDEEKVAAKAQADSLVTKTLKDAAAGNLASNEPAAGFDYTSEDDEAEVGSTGAQGSLAMNAASEKDTSEKTETASQTASKAPVKPAVSAHEKSPVATKVSSALDPISMGNLFGSFGARGPEEGKSSFDPIILSALGVKARLAKENIFSYARQNYRSFAKWQRTAKKSRLASR